MPNFGGKKLLIVLFSTDKPRATNLTSNVEKMDNVFEGQTITFFCSADSVPPAVYEFRFKREFLGYSKDGEFVIQSVNSSHKGEYECVPSNILGIGDIAAMSLNVLCTCRNVEIFSTLITSLFTLILFH